MFVLIGHNLHGTVTDVNQIDQHFNPLAASHHIVTKRPERFLFIVACFNILANIATVERISYGHFRSVQVQDHT